MEDVKVSSHDHLDEFVAGGIVHRLRQKAWDKECASVAELSELWEAACLKCLSPTIVHNQLNSRQTYASKIIILIPVQEPDGELAVGAGRRRLPAGESKGVKPHGLMGIFRNLRKEISRKSLIRFCDFHENHLSSERYCSNF